MSQEKTCVVQDQKAPKIYTKKGDRGMTTLYNGTKISKNHYITHTLGKLDEFNVRIGALKIGGSEKLAHITPDIFKALEEIQHNTMNMSSVIATPNPSKVQKKRLMLDKDLEKTLEKHIDWYTERMPKLTNFVLPGHNKLCILAHSARVQARECERFISGLDDPHPEIQKYFNRMSDYLFTLARWFNPGKDQLHGGRA